MDDKKSYVNGIFRDMPGKGFSASVDERAELLRAVSKGLIRAHIPLERRRKIIVELQQDFGVELSEHGIEHFMGA